MTPFLIGVRFLIMFILYRNGLFFFPKRKRKIIIITIIINNFLAAVNLKQQMICLVFWSPAISSVSMPITGDRHLFVVLLLLFLELQNFPFMYKIESFAYSSMME